MNVVLARGVEVTAWGLAGRYVGMREIRGAVEHHPAILAMLQLDADWPRSDETPWCSGFANWIAWHLSLPRSKSLAARSWLHVGRPVDLADAMVGFDVAVLWRGKRAGPFGHVGFYGGHDENGIRIRGGNQRDAVSTASYSLDRLLGIVRLLETPPASGGRFPARLDARAMP